MHKITKFSGVVQGVPCWSIIAAALGKPTLYCREQAIVVVPGLVLAGFERAPTEQITMYGLFSGWIVERPLVNEFNKIQGAQSEIDFTGRSGGCLCIDGW